MNHNRYTQCKFFTTCGATKDLPNVSFIEVAICGYSNVGKSSLINTLTNQTRLAFASKTPGRTQCINYFAVNAAQTEFLVDLPGYGYADVPLYIKSKWQTFLGEYIRSRVPLRALVLIIDARRTLRELDYLMLETSKHVHIVVSKIDKLSHSQKASAMQMIKKQLQGRTNYTIQEFSSTKRIGIDELVNTLDCMFDVNALS